MAKQDAKKFIDHLSGDQGLRDELKKCWEHVEALGKKHGYHFNHTEYFDVVHEQTGMTKVGKGDDDDHPDTCIVFLSEAPKY